MEFHWAIFGLCVVLVALTLNFFLSPLCNKLYRRIGMFFFWLAERNKIKAIANYIKEEDGPVIGEDVEKEISLPKKPAGAMVTKVNIQDGIGRDGKPIVVPSKLEFADGSNISIHYRTPEEQQAAMNIIKDGECQYCKDLSLEKKKICSVCHGEGFVNHHPNHEGEAVFAEHDEVQTSSSVAASTQVEIKEQACN